MYASPQGTAPASSGLRASRPAGQAGKRAGASGRRALGERGWLLEVRLVLMSSCDALFEISMRIFVLVKMLHHALK